MRWFFDFDDGDFAVPLSDRMAMDMDSGELHIVSGWQEDGDE